MEQFCTQGGKVLYSAWCQVMEAHWKDAVFRVGGRCIQAGRVLSRYTMWKVAVYSLRKPPFPGRPSD